MPFTNPIIPGSHPDPSVCRAGDDYFLVTSSFEYVPGVPLFHSKDLVHWRQIGHCLTRPSQVPLADVKYSDGIYAPTIRYGNGVFYVTATNATRGGHFFVHTRDPFGPWSEPVWVAQCGIDPSLLFDDHGTVYFTSTNTGIDVDSELEVWPHTCAIVQSVIDINTGKCLSATRPIWQGTGGKFPEGPHVYKIDGWYYLLIAEGGTEHGHTVVIARSRSPWGPWEPRPHNPLLTHRSYDSPIHATGHGDLIQAHDGSWWIVFLGIRPHGYGPVHHLGRETFLAPVQWTGDGWPVVNGNGKVALHMDTPCLPAHPWPAGPVRDDFDEPVLRPCWNFLRNPYPQDWSLNQRPGSLRLHGSPVTLGDQDSPAFVGRRQQHFVCDVATLLRFEPQ
jgi:alpha-N-arabinofuranosidase